MATTFDAPAGVRRDDKFFFVMAWIMAATIVAGFAFNLAMGRSSFNVPWIYHVHAFVFFGWVVLYLVQNTLMFTGSIALHKRLGWLSILWLPAMVVLGSAMTIVSLRTHGGPPFFDENEFLFSNIGQLLVVAGLVFAAVAMRRRTDWHRRLMYSSMAILTGPGLGRLLPMPFFIPYAWWLDLTVAAIFPIIGMIADKRRTGRVHPAWSVVFIAVIAMQIVADGIAYSPYGYAVTKQVIAGTPGADRSMQAFFPS
jgi:hypothetical protein